MSKWKCEVVGQLLIFNADNTVTDNSAMTARVVAAKNQSCIRTYSTIDNSTRSMGVAISTSRPAFSSCVRRGLLRRDEEHRKPGGKGDGANGHAGGKELANVMFETFERIAWIGHSTFTK